MKMYLLFLIAAFIVVFDLGYARAQVRHDDPRFTPRGHVFPGFAPERRNFNRYGRARPGVAAPFGYQWCFNPAVAGGWYLCPL